MMIMGARELYGSMEELGTSRHTLFSSPSRPTGSRSFSFHGWVHCMVRNTNHKIYFHSMYIVSIQASRIFKNFTAVVKDQHECAMHCKYFLEHFVPSAFSDCMDMYTCTYIFIPMCSLWPVNTQWLPSVPATLTPEGHVSLPTLSRTTRLAIISAWHSRPWEEQECLWVQGTWSSAFVSSDSRLGPGRLC